MSAGSPRLLFQLVFLGLYTQTLMAQAPVRRQITRSDETRIIQSVKNVIKSLEGEYDFFLTEVIDERKRRMDNLTLPGSERMFLNGDVIVENDFVDKAFENLEKKDREKKLEAYFKLVADDFGADKDGEGPNVGKSVVLDVRKISKVQAASSTDSLSVYVLFEIDFEGGKARNGYPFKKSMRIAEVQVEKQGKSWVPLIRSIYYDLPNRRIDESRNAVVILDEVLGSEVKFEDAILRELITVSKEPILKAYKIDDLWGLLLDDRERKILVQPIYCEIGDFGEESLALVCRDGSWGYINKAGEEVIECRYDAAEPFRKSRAKVQIGPQTFLIDTKGTVLR